MSKRRGPSARRRWARRERGVMGDRRGSISNLRGSRALAKTEAFKQSSRDRKRVEMLFAHLKRILRLGRLRLRGPCGAQFEFTFGSDCAEPPQACQVGRPATTVRPFVRCVSVASVSKVERKSPAQSSG